MQKPKAKTILRFSSWGCSSATWDFLYHTTWVDKQGYEHSIPGGRFAHWILGFFIGKEFINYGEGYPQRAKMLAEYYDAINKPKEES